MKRREVAKIIAGAVTAGASFAAYALALRPWHSKWGATQAECDETIPGDELVPRPLYSMTHAITINAAASEVWPWLVQMGQTRGGFYSHAWLENLVGCHMRNADRIVPEWQSLRAGDVVWLHPKAPPLPVAIVEPHRAIVLGGPIEGQGARRINSDGTWAFYLKPMDSNTTRLLVRGRWNTNPGLLNRAINYALFEPAHFIMERKMMLGIKQRAEGEIKA
jgi:hypothetical protein